MRTRWPRLWSAVVVATAGCSSPRPPPAPLPPAPGLLEVAMSEYRFEHQPAIRPGRTVFRIHNRGRLAHHLTLLRLPADLPPLEAELRSPDQRAFETVRLVPDVNPDDSATFAVDLVPGRYGLVCFVADPDREIHARKGMTSELQAP